ncbi:MAG: hypothetical protein HRF40_10090 [Nitrososphaera sp.]|jgi:hypothetical protein
MAKLIVPNGSTKVVKYGDFWSKKKWHILRPGTKSVGICGCICIDPEYSTIEDIRDDDLCSLCWRFGKEWQKNSKK